ncbi:MAG: response regulator [Verrucomicrobia subdivision 3 bacterium]|nr:response regulator [Limisphaerales bacterium]
MQNPYDYKKFAILYVDDEEKSLKYFARAFEDQFRILTASSAQAGLKILEEHKDDIGLLITDQRMPGEKGTWLLEKARQLRPRIVRILATAYSDMDAAVAAVNTGAIYKYIVKPWDPPQLDATLKRGLEFFIVQRERDQLLKEKLSVLHNMMIADRMVSLGLLAAGLSHHIRNSLVAVKTFLDLAPSKLQEENLDMSGLRNPDFWKEYYQNVQSQIEKINNMLKDLWAASEPPSFKFCDEVSVREILQGVLTRIDDSIKAKNIKITNDVPASLPALIVDRPKFIRLFELLFRDELVSLPAGSSIVVSAQTEHVEGKDSVLIEVRDNGPGLPKEALRLIFDPFVVRTDSPLEYGINLMACYFIVHHHSGRIEARSEEGKGTTFTLRFPRDPNRAGLVTEDKEFLEKVLLNETVWEKMLASD